MRIKEMKFALCLAAKSGHNRSTEKTNEPFHLKKNRLSDFFCEVAFKRGRSKEKNAFSALKAQKMRIGFYCLLNTTKFVRQP